MPARVGLLIVRSISSRPAARAAPSARENAIGLELARHAGREHQRHYHIRWFAVRGHPLVAIRIASPPVRYPEPSRIRRPRTADREPRTADMSLTLTFDELLRYTNAERDKWRRGSRRIRTRWKSSVQPGGRLPTVGKLIDHIFLVERRHPAAADRRAAVAIHRPDRQQRAAAVRLRRVGASRAGAVRRPISTATSPTRSGRSRCASGSGR